MNLCIPIILYAYFSAKCILWNTHFNVYITVFWVTWTCKSYTDVLMLTPYVQDEADDGIARSLVMTTSLRRRHSNICTNTVLCMQNT